MARLLHREVEAQRSRLKQHPHAGIMELDEDAAPVLHDREADTTAHGGRSRDASVLSREVLDVARRIDAACPDCRGREPVLNLNSLPLNNTS